MSELIGFRGSHENDKDILDWLGRFTPGEKSNEIRRLLRLGIALSKGEFLLGPIVSRKTAINEKHTQDSPKTND